MLLELNEVSKSFGGVCTLQSVLLILVILEYKAVSYTHLDVYKRQIKNYHTITDIHH